MTRREAVPAPERADFVHHASTTPEAAALDPRAPDMPAPAAQRAQVSSEASSAPREAMK
jgi:hypothetical protein